MSVDANFHPQYNFEDGNLLLLASDGVLFRVHQHTLKNASAIFNDMLSIPHDSRESPQADPISLAEPSPVLAFLLNSVYPHVDLPAVASFDEAWTIVKAAEKYDMPRVLSALRAAVVGDETFTAENLKLFALASKCEWESVLASTSEKTLEHKLASMENLPILRTIPSDYLGLLMMLHESRKACILRKFELEKMTNYRQNWDVGTSMNEFGPEPYLYEWWTCPCDKGHLDHDLVRNGVEVYKAVVHAYLAEEPKGTRLFAAESGLNSGNLFRYDQFVDHLKCAKCRTNLFDVEKVQNMFKDMEKTLPKTIFDLESLAQEEEQSE